LAREEGKEGTPCLDEKDVEEKIIFTIINSNE
jgi:hypothetical protein